MITVDIHLDSAVTGKRSSLGKMVIRNDGTGTRTWGHYNVTLYNDGVVWKTARVTDFPRERLGAYDLMYRAMRACGIGERNGG